MQANAELFITVADDKCICDSTCLHILKKSKDA